MLTIFYCVKDGEKQATPKGRGRGYRYGLPNDEYYFKSTEEMKNSLLIYLRLLLTFKKLDKIEPLV